MPSVQTRELEYFVAVAEELHYGRAAARLHVSQPALSKTIRQLEGHLDVQLFERDSRRVALTASGEVLLRHAREVLDALGVAVRRTREAAHDVPLLRVVMKPGGDANLMPSILDVYSARPGARPVDVLLAGLDDRVAHLHDGRADLALLYLPLDDLAGLRSVTLMAETRVAVLPRHHRLATRRSLTMAELVDEPIARFNGVGDPDLDIDVTDLARLASSIALGRAIAVLPPSTLGMLQADLVAVPVVDALPSTLVLAWAHTRSSPTVEEFADTAVRVARRRSDLVQAYGLSSHERAVDRHEP